MKDDYVEVPVVRRNGVDGNVTVEYMTKDGSAQAGVVAGVHPCTDLGAWLVDNGRWAGAPHWAVQEQLMLSGYGYFMHKVPPQQRKCNAAATQVTRLAVVLDYDKREFRESPLVTPLVMWHGPHPCPLPMCLPEQAPTTPP
jgi:hypothetical protein